MDDAINTQHALNYELRVRGLSDTADTLWREIQHVMRDRAPVDACSRDGFLGLNGPVPCE